ncbi:MAG: hypothetical protein OER04_12645 [Cyclobacteriaceae bacterium]|nr:hypothetical protein [Cyclobacteriaceae bacterium]
MQSEQLAGSGLTPLIKNVSFLLKYGTLVAVLVASYLLSDPDAPATSGSGQEYVEIKQKKLNLFSTDYQVVSNNLY